MKQWFVFALLLVTPAVFAQEKKKLNPGVYALFETSMGNFTCELYQRQAPETVANFIGLAEGTKDYKDPRGGQATKGKPYYNGVIFHRVIENFMIQGGDPTGTGTGGPGYNIRDEIARDLTFDREGRLAMANTGRPNSGGAQFFVTVAPVTQLNGGYTIFGQVVDGMDVVKKISQVEKKAQPGSPSEKSRPVTDIVLKKVTIQRIAEK
jgi:peptidyl-prolyl cis-trans isomerase A (cyclophilin A)